MSLFLLTFLVAYSSLHFFFYSRVKVLLPSGLMRLILFLLLAAMVLTPVAVRLLERNEFELPARILALAGYSWMGFLFLADCLFLLALILNLVLRICMWLHMPISPVPQATITVLVLIMTACIWGYGYVEAQNIRVERVAIETAKWPTGEGHLKIAQISDVHLGLLNRTARLRNIVNLIRSEKPDLLVSTGDLVDGNMGDVVQLAGILASLDLPHGKIAILGNHEVYAGLDQSLRALEVLGFTILREEYLTIGKLINIAGVDDPATSTFADEGSLLRSVQNGLFTLFLKHRPAVPSTSLGLFDLQLSGHTHRGQIFPFNLLSARIYPMQDGLYHLESGSKLYTSRGTATWGPPIRVLSPPEVTIITIAPSKVALNQ